MNLCEIDRRIRGRANEPLMVGDNFQFESCFCVVAGLAQGPEARLAKNINEGGFVGVYPLNRGQATGCAIDAVRHALVENKSDEASEEALNKVENVVDWRANFPD